MQIVLDVVAAWTALDVVVLLAWHRMHIASRRPAGRRRRDGRSAVVSAPWA